MCLIIETKKDIPISDELMRNFAERNDDGFGFMYVKDNVLETEKYVDQSVDLLIERYQALKEYEPMIHLRMKTHGLVDHENTHPYPCGKGIWLMHNGVLSTGNAKDKDKSDTWHFIENVIKPLFEWGNPHKIIRTPIFKKIMEYIIGGANRFVLGDRGGFVIINDTSWVTISEEATGAKGLRVSNSYAWSERAFHPKGPWSYQSSIPREPGYGRVRKNSSDGLIQLDTDLYVDEDGAIWEKSVSGFWRAEKPNKRQRKAKKRYERQQRIQAEATQAVEDDTTSPVLVLPALVGKPTIIVQKEDEQDDVEQTTVVNLYHYAQETYLEHLKKEWSSMSEDALNAAVYTEPEEAAKLLHKVLHND
jgi:hypothetical protein